MLKHFPVHLYMVFLPLRRIAPVALMALLLCGCAVQSAPPPQATLIPAAPAPTNEPAGIVPAEQSVYEFVPNYNGYFRHFDKSIISGNGDVIISDQYSAFIIRNHEGTPTHISLGIADAIKNDKSKNKQTVVTNALFSLEGKQLTPFAYGYFESGDGIILSYSQGGYTLLDFDGNIVKEGIPQSARAQITRGHLCVWEQRDETTGTLSFFGAGGKLLGRVEGVEHFYGSADGDLMPVRKNGKWGYVRTDGSVAVPFEYNEAESFVGDAAWVCKVNADGSTVQKLLGTDGSVLYEGTFGEHEYMYAAGDSLIGIRDNANNGVSRYMDRQGNTVLSGYGYMDFTQQSDKVLGVGQIWQNEIAYPRVILRDYTALGVGEGDEKSLAYRVFGNDLICVEEYTEGSQFIGFYDTTGKLAVPLDGYKYSTSYSRNYIVLARIDGLYDVFGPDGKVVIEGLKFATLYDDTRLRAQKGFVTGIMDTRGNWVYSQSIFNGLED